MAKLNAKYELMAVYSLAKGEEVAKELVEKFKSKIEAAATLDEVERVLNITDGVLRFLVTVTE